MESGTGEFLNPQKVLGQLEIKANLKIAHFGCGHGYFDIPLAKMVGPDGKIYSIDVLKEALEEVKTKAEKEGLVNIETIRGNLEIVGGSKIKDNACDMVLLANILFQSQKKTEVIKEARRALKQEGKLIIIDWQPQGSTLTSGSGWRISPQEARQIAEEQNFAFEKEFETDDYHYGLIFKKP